MNKLIEAVDLIEEYIATALVNDKPVHHGVWFPFFGDNSFFIARYPVAIYTSSNMIHEISSREEFNRFFKPDWLLWSPYSDTWKEGVPLLKGKHSKTLLIPCWFERKDQPPKLRYDYQPEALNETYTGRWQYVPPLHNTQL